MRGVEGDAPRGAWVAAQGLDVLATGEFADIDLVVAVRGGHLGAGEQINRLEQMTMDILIILSSKRIFKIPLS